MKVFILILVNNGNCISAKPSIGNVRLFSDSTGKVRFHRLALILGSGTMFLKTRFLFLLYINRGAKFAKVELV